MNKNDLKIIVSKKLSKTKKDVDEIIDLLLDEIIVALTEGDKVVLSNFGTFEKSITKAIDIYSPYDGKLLKNISQTRIRFKSSNYLKDKLKNN